ncbi:Mitochondrial distribution and morphology protein 12 [Arachnomyces sp. PD_36]|nr:Mitochondrial distribution and morphology protein 12 [Arachnomyces sp. PD_36]
MSVEINWETITSGPDGDALAEKIRSFIHDKFQQVPLPRFIRSVKVESFDFGTICPEIEIKDLCDPFTDFYEEDEGDEFSDSDDGLPQGTPQSEAMRNGRPQSQSAGFNHDFHSGSPRDHSLRIPTDIDSGLPTLRSPIHFGDHRDHHLPRSGTPGIPGGTSNLSYYYMSLGGLSGSQTPLAAVAGGTQFPTGWPDSAPDPRELQPSPFGPERGNPQHRQPIHGGQQPRIEVEADSNPPSRPSTSNTTPSASSNINHQNSPTPSRSDPQSHVPLQEPQPHPDIPQPPRMREQKTDDMQVVCRLKYAGDITLSLTAEILLDYPMPSFVGLPLKLNITGMTFDGVAVLAYIRRRAHFCFLSPEDADALLGPDEEDGDGNDRGEESSSHHHGLGFGGSARSRATQKKNGGLLQEIHVESEIGRKENGKQVLKNVGKVERFVLQEVRRIFEDEFVFPSFWTFLT